MAENISFRVSAIDDFSRNMNRFRRNVDSMTESTRHMADDMRSAYREMNETMSQFRGRQMEAEYGFFQLGRSSDEYAGRTGDLMAEIQRLGRVQRNVADEMLNANTFARSSFYQTVGAMMNLSTQAEKIRANYNRMRNPLLMVNNAGLTVAHSLNRLANAGNASVLALRMLGPTASMKALNDMTMMITAGLMRFQMVALAAIVTSVLLYSTLHKEAMKSVKGYEKSFERMKSSVRKAFEPMVQVFGAAMIKLFDFVNAVAHLITHFNEAHPVLAKMIQGVLMLIPALTLLLSPLAIGIGLTAGFLAAWNSIWMMIGPLITGLAAMSATVWIVAAAIIGLTIGLTHLWKNNEDFRNAVISAWEKIKKKAIEVFGFLPGLLDKAKQGFNTLKDAVTSALSGDFSKLGEVFKVIGPTIAGALIGGIPGILISASRFLPAIAAKIQEHMPQIQKVAQDIINNIVTFLITDLPKLVHSGVQILMSLVNGIAQNLPIIISAAISIIGMILDTIVQYLPMIINAGIRLLTSLIEGISQMLPVLIPLAISMIMGIVNILIENLPKLLEAGIQILIALIDGIVQVLPMLIDAAVQLIEQIAQALIENLPTIIDSGVKILLALIDGIIQILPQLVDAAITLITSLVTTLIDNAPKLLESGKQLIEALVDGVVALVPEIISAAGEIGKALLDEIMKIDLYDIGADIIQGMINGMGSLLSSVASKAREIASAAKNAVENFFDINSPSRVMMEIGGFVGEGFAKGIGSMVKDVRGVSNEMAFAAAQPITQPRYDYAAPSSAPAQPAQFNVTLNYSGTGAEEDATRMIDIVERELANRFGAQLRLQGVR